MDKCSRLPFSATLGLFLSAFQFYFSLLNKLCSNIISIFCLIFLETKKLTPLTDNSTSIPPLTSRLCLYTHLLFRDQGHCFRITDRYCPFCFTKSILFIRGKVLSLALIFIEPRAVVFSQY